MCWLTGVSFTGPYELTPLKHTDNWALHWSPGPAPGPLGGGGIERIRLVSNLRGQSRKLRVKMTTQGLKHPGVQTSRNPGGMTWDSYSRE